MNRTKPERSASAGSTGIIKSISLWQPWGQLIVCGSKRFETRSWSTNHRGPLLIHAAKRYQQEERYWTDTLDREGYLDTGVAGMPLGALIGVCRLVEVWPSNHPALRAMMTPYEHRFGDFRPGRYAWELEDVQTFEEPIPWRGRQGLWGVPLRKLPPQVQEIIDGDAEPTISPSPEVPA